MASRTAVGPWKNELDLIIEFDHGERYSSVTLQWPCTPIPAMSNMRGRWQIAKHAAAQRKTVADIFLGLGSRNRMRAAEGVCIEFTRIAPRKLDDDNLPNAFKAIRDEIVEQLGFADDSARSGIRFIYHQSSLGRRKTGVRVLIEWKAEAK